MADPFEVRMRFTSLLTHLSASTTSSMKAAHYALKHRDMDEDLHSCIIEILESQNTTSAVSAASMNNRANIMYFLEHFCEMAMREGHQPYVEFVRRDIGKIVNCVAASGANVKVVRRVVSELGTKGVLKIEVVQGIEDDLKLKEQERGALLGDGDVPTTADLAQTDYIKSVIVDGEVSRKSAGENNWSVPRTGGKDGKANGVSKADKRAIEQRIEEVWAINGDDENELEKMWEEGSDLSEDDYIIAGEEADERKQFARYHQNLLAR
jgi:CTD kinase subunit gamma